MQSARWAALAAVIAGVIVVLFQVGESEPPCRLRLRAPDGTTPRDVEVTDFDALEFGTQQQLESTGTDGGDFLYRATPGRFYLRVQPDPNRIKRHDFFPVEREVELRAGDETSWNHRSSPGTTVRAPPRGRRAGRRACSS